MKQIKILNLILAVVLALTVAEPAFAMRDASGPAGPYGDGMNLYQYVRGSPARFVDYTGASAADASSVDYWQEAAKAVDAHDWVTATNAMNAAAVQAANTKQGPQYGKKCCCSGADKGKCHIYVTHLARVGQFVQVGSGGGAVSRAQLGYPPFPTATGNVFLAEGRRLVATVVTLVQLKHDEGKDTSGCYLVTDVEDMHWRDNGVFFPAYAKYDVGSPISSTPGFRWKFSLNIAYGGNWYIDSPGFIPTSYRRFFQQSVSVEDESRHKIEGLTANYGWSYQANWASGGISWTLWPENVGTAYKDPKQRVAPTLALTENETSAYWNARNANEAGWKEYLP